MTGRTDWTVFASMVREEWRLHSTLFGGGRFAAFAPVAVADGWVTRLPTLWLTATATFLVGLSITFTGIGLSTHGRRGRAVLVAGVALVAVAALAGVDVAAYLPYSLYAGGDVRGFVGVVAIPLLPMAGLAIYDPTYERPARTVGDAFSSWNARLHDPLLTKTLVDVSRSGGGVWKVLFSGGILFVVSAYLLRVAESITGLRPSPGLAFGSILGLTGFTTYNWLTQFDDTGFYLSQPVSIPAVFRAKFRAFLLLGFPTAFVYFLVAVVAFGARLADVVAGVAVLTGLSLYLFGLVVYLAGFSPNEFLFDTVLFVAFTVAIAAPLVPVLVVGFVGGSLSVSALALVTAGSALFGALGRSLYRRALPRWDRAYRRGLQ